MTITSRKRDPWKIGAWMTRATSAEDPCPLPEKAGGVLTTTDHGSLDSLVRGSRIRRQRHSPHPVISSEIQSSSGVDSTARKRLPQASKQRWQLNLSTMCDVKRRRRRPRRRRTITRFQAYAHVTISMTYTYQPMACITLGRLTFFLFFVTCTFCYSLYFKL